MSVMEASRIFLIYEFNCYPSLMDRWKVKLRRAPVEGLGSVWIANEYDNCPDDYETKALKLIGPLPTEQAMGFRTRLREVLTAAGLNVIDETVADD